MGVLQDGLARFAHARRAQVPPGGDDSSPGYPGGAALPLGESPPGSVERFLRRAPRERSPMVAPEVAAEQMGRTVAEIEQMVKAGIMRAELVDGEIVRVQATVLLRGPRLA